jgi:hypothetical protein
LNLVGTRRTWLATGSRSEDVEGGGEGKLARPVGERWSNGGGEACVARMGPGCLAERKRKKKSAPNLATSLRRKGEKLARGRDLWACV